MITWERKKDIKEARVSEMRINRFHRVGEVGESRPMGKGEISFWSIY